MISLLIVKFAQKRFDHFVQNFFQKSIAILCECGIIKSSRGEHKKGDFKMTNYKVTIKTNTMILGYVVKDSTSTDDAMIRACRCAKFECGVQAEDILEVIVKPL